MSAHARHQTLAFLLIVIVLFSGVFIGLGLIPIHLSGVKQVILNIGGEAQNVGHAETYAIKHYDDGSTERVSGDTFLLNPLLKPLASLGQQEKHTDFVEFNNEVVYLPQIDLQARCLQLGWDFWIFSHKVCPVDALLVVHTDISITVDGKAVWSSPSNGEYVAYSTTGLVKQMAPSEIQYWNDFYKFFGIDLQYTNVQLFQPGDVTVPWSLDKFNPDSYRQQDRSITVQVIGNQTYELYPMYSEKDLTPHGPDVPVPLKQYQGTDLALVKPAILQYTRPIMDFPALTVTKPDFVLTTSQSSVTLSTNTANDGNKGFVSVYVGAYNNYMGTVTFAVRDMPSGVASNYDPPTVSFTTTTKLGSSKLQLVAATNAHEGEYSALIVATTPDLPEHTIALIIKITTSIQPCPGGAGCLQMPTTLDASTSSDVVTLFPFNVKGVLTSGPAPILGATISITGDWGAATQVVTNEKGEFSATLTAPSKEGIYHITVLFGGDSKYAPSNQVDLIISVRAIPTEWIIIIAIIIIAIVIIAIVGIAMSRRKAGMP